MTVSLPGNPNLQEDEDGTTNNTIFTSLNYLLINDLYHAPARYIFMATNAAETATIPFVVDPVYEMQTISGAITGGTTTIPGVTVRLLDKWQRPMVWTIADDTGAYVLNVKQPGEYYLAPIAYGYVAMATPVTIAANQSLVNHTLTVTAGTYHITGKVIDAVSSTGIDGVWVQAKGANDTAVAITSTDGSYELLLPVGQYAINTLADTTVPGSFAKGYINLNNHPLNISVNGNATGMDIALTTGDIHVVGRVLDPAGNPVPGLPVEGRVRGTIDVREPVTFSISDAAGNYSLGLFSGTNWDISLDNTTAQSLGYLGTKSHDLSTSVGPLTGHDLTVNPITAWIQGTVKDSTNRLISGIEVRLYNADSSITTSVLTAEDGTYRLGAFAGTWFIEALTTVKGLPAVPEQPLNLADAQSATNDFIVDVTAPVVTITLPAAGITNRSKPALAYTASDGTVVVKVDGVIVNKLSGDTLDVLSNGQHTVRIESTDTANNLGYAEVTFTVDYTPLSIISPLSLLGTTGVPYNQLLMASGGVTPYTWSITSGSLPADLTLNPSTGAITGTPTTVGTTTFTVQVEDIENFTATSSLTISIYAPVSITTTSLPSGYIATAYSQTLTASGGNAPYSWTLDNGTLPPGMSLNASNGAITGTPTATGTSDITFQVTDANNSIVTRSLSIEVNAALAINTVSLPAGNVAVDYSQVLVATGGKAPYAWAISSGTLPAGLVLDNSIGSISGTPTATGSPSFIVEVTDANGVIATKSMSLIIAAALSDLIVTSVSGPSSGTSGKKTITVAATVKNNGQGSAESSLLTFYLSTDATITTADNSLGTKTVNALAAGEIQTVTGSFAIPTAVAAGTYYYGAIADTNGVVMESNETNNALAGNTIIVR